MKRIREKLLRWFARQKRDLPWRNTRDPYRIWISEVMLQQTRVDTVIPYYERFVKRFPTVSSLADAHEQDVLKAWEGLGYYSRARNLRASARELAAAYGGKLPRTAGELGNLPGFGPYTSAAVASIAFGEPSAVVDGNVRRVLSRLFAARDGFEKLAQKLLDPDHAGDFNQALMELGATVCLSKNPRCLLCPVRNACKALARNGIDRFPPARKRAVPQAVHATVLALRKRETFLLLHRPPTGRFGGLWEFPTIETSGKNDPLRLGLAHVREVLDMEPERLRSLGSFHHQLTHRTFHVTALTADVTRSTAHPRGKWVTFGRIRDLPLSRMQQKVLNLVETGKIV